MFPRANVWRQMVKVRLTLFLKRVQDLQLRLVDLQMKETPSRCRRRSIRGLDLVRSAWRMMRPDTFTFHFLTFLPLQTVRAALQFSTCVQQMVGNPSQVLR